MKKRKKSIITITERKLGREHAYAQVWLDEENNLIEIDPRLNQKSTLRKIIHELSHIALPEAKESEVLELEKIIGNKLWELGYRKLD